MKALVAIVIGVLVFVGQPLFAAPNSSQPRAISRAAHPAGAPSKASSFAPRARSKRHVYGAPIERPIVASHPRPEQHKPNSP
ncbi:MAG: hypothetical protein JWN85_4936 [Gammaproteobacteria bacterium]|nr:hypothetical protein [Gammaproteobacteria bacterium]